MGVNLLRVYRSAANAQHVVPAPAPAGDLFLAEGTNVEALSTKVQLLRVAMSGAVAWHKEITIPPAASSSFGLTVNLAANTTHVVLTASYDGAADNETAVLLYAADGTLVWQTVLTLQATQQEALAIAGDNTVYIGGLADFGADSCVVKLSPTTGAVLWTITPRPASGAFGTNQGGAISVLSGGDPVIYALGPTHTDGQARTYIQRLSAADGSVSWSRALNWPTTLHYAALAVAPDDSIYVVGRAHAPATYNELPITKLDSSGGTIWDRLALRGSGSPSGGFSLTWEGAPRASAAGLHIPCGGMWTVASTPWAGYGELFVPASGTIAAGSVTITTASSISASALGSVVSGYGASDHGSFGYMDERAGPFTQGVVVRTDATAGVEVFGPYTKRTYVYDLVAGAATSTATSYARASVAAVTSSAVTISETASSLLVESYAVSVSAQATGFVVPVTFGLPEVAGTRATGIPSTLVFGALGAAVLVHPTPWATSTTLGTPTVLNRYFAPGSTFNTAFGVPGTNFDLAYVAASVPVGTDFGEPWGVLAMPGRPHAVHPIEPGTTCGTPAATASAALAAEGFSSTGIGAPSHARKLGAAALEALFAAGNASALAPCRAAGSSSTVFGLAQVSMLGVCTGVPAAVHFGVFLASTATHSAPGSITPASTVGAPNAVQRFHLRSVRTTAFGAYRSERTA